MRYTDHYKLPFPEPTDALSAGAVTQQLLAHRLELLLQPRQSVSPHDYMTVASGWALESGDLATSHAMTTVRLTVRRTGADLWLNGGMVPNQAGNHIGTWKTSGPLADAGPTPWLACYLGPMGGQWVGAEDTRPAAVAMLPGDRKLYVTNVTDGVKGQVGALATGDLISFGGTFVNNFAYYPPVS